MCKSLFLHDALYLVASDALLDYNVFHVKQDHSGSSYIAVKYDIDDIMYEYLKGTNIKILYIKIDLNSIKPCCVSYMHACNAFVNKRYIET